MRKHEPKPLIEEHYHIQELIDRQEKRTEEKNYHREKAKEKEEREKLIADAKPVEDKDFFCRHCQDDFTCQSVLQIEVDWSNSAQRIAFYKAKHKKCGNWCIRLVTDRQRDGYWIRSRRVRADQGKHHNDLLQPFETGFNLLYGKR